MHRKLSKWQLPVQPVMKFASKWYFHFNVCQCSNNDVMAWKRFLHHWPFESGAQCWSTCISYSFKNWWISSDHIKPKFYPFLDASVDHKDMGRVMEVHAVFFTLQWRHNGRNSISNHQPHDCLLNRLLRCRSKKTSKLRVTGLCAGNSPGTGEFPPQMASKAENVSIWWRYHDLADSCTSMTHPIWITSN